jgi:hypothetical protein
MKFGIGQPMRRHEDLRLSPGEAYGHPFNTPSLPYKLSDISQEIRTVHVAFEIRRDPFRHA